MTPFEVLKAGLRLLNPRERAYLLVVVVIQIFIGLIDLVALALVAALGSLGASYVSGFALPQSIKRIIEAVGLGDVQTQQLLVIVALATGFLFVFRSAATLILTRRIALFLANRQTRISVELAKKISTTSYAWLKRRDLNEVIYATTDGVGALMLGVIGSFMSVLGEAFFLTLILIGLIVVDPTTALVTLIFFSVLGISSYRLVRSYATRLGNESAKFSIHGRNQISSMLLAYKEIYAFQRQQKFLDDFVSTRQVTTQAQGKATWLQQVPKASAEVGLVIGGAGLIGLQAWQSDAASGLSTLLVFLAAASRLTPSLLRIQSSFLSYRNFAGGAEITLKTLTALENADFEPVEIRESASRSEYKPLGVEVSNLSFRYPDGNEEVVSNISLRIEPGSFVALAGSSGSGKTTLADILIGIYAGSTGSVRFNGIPNREWVKANPGGIGYVPQSPYILGGDFITNIALGIPENEVDLHRIDEVIAKAQLIDLVRAMPDGLHTDLSNFGSRLSGGEKQRLALARALYTNPSLLIIDEGTSALDGRTEFEVTRAILGLRNTLTIIVIAHRLASIKEADQIFLLDKGHLIASGDFKTLRESSKEFQEQVSYMNLD
jgi:ABC-type multidrug transport system fused ATPase/permease subunit